MTFYESVKELCMDLGVDREDLTDFSQLSPEEYSITVKNNTLMEMIDRIKEDGYYKKKLRRVSNESIDLIEKQYLNDKWTFVLIRFTEIPVGVNCIVSTLSVPYTTNMGKSVNLETQAIHDSVKNEEIADRM